MHTVSESYILAFYLDFTIQSICYITIQREELEIWFKIVC